MSSATQFIYSKYRSKISTGPRNKVRLSPLYSFPSEFRPLFVQSPKEGTLSSPTSSRTTHPDRSVPSQNSLKTQSLCHINYHCQHLTHPSKATFSQSPSLDLLCSAHAVPLYSPQPFPEAAVLQLLSCVLALTSTGTATFS